MITFNEPEHKGISPAKYAKLSEDEQFYYDPIYKKYKVTKYRDYETCDLGHEHFMGWVEKRTPIGEPCKYVKDTSMTRQTMRLVQPAIINSITSSNILMDRVLNKQKDWN